MTGVQTNTSRRVRYLVQLAVLVAIILVLEFANIGIVRVPLPFFPLEFTILQIPVIIGAIVLGPSAGGILGGIFGLLSFWECFGKSAFGVVLLGIDPLGTFLTCVPTRLLMGVLCGLIFRALSKSDRTRAKLPSFGVSSLAGALLNTILFTGVLIAFFYQTEFIQGIAQGFSESFGIVMNPFLFVVFFVGIQGLIEAVVATIAGAAVSKALYKALTR